MTVRDLMRKTGGVRQKRGNHGNTLAEPRPAHKMP
jgi:hypothetical protein